MRQTLAIAALLAMVGTGAMAQQSPPATNGPQNGAINSRNTADNPTLQPVKGRNSFTEGEARSRIQAHGYADVTGLRKDNDGIWRGLATKDGKQVEVALDYQGHIVEGNPAQGSAGPGVPAPNAAGR